MLPYVAYTVIRSLPLSDATGLLSPGLAFLAVTCCLVIFRKSYSFGALKSAHILWALGGFPVALLLWVGPLYLFGYFTQGDPAYQTSIQIAYIALRVLNAVILVSLFEELLMRVFFMEWFFQSMKSGFTMGLFNSLLDNLDSKPTAISTLPFNIMSLIGTTLIFTVGHTPKEWISAILYFSVTNLVYYKTRSLWTCIIIHGLTNLSLVVSTAFFGITFP